MFKFFGRVGLALCVGVAIAVGLAIGSQFVSRFDARTLLKGALAALEPVPAQPGAVAVLAAQAGGIDAQPQVADPLEADEVRPAPRQRLVKRSPRGNLVRPVVLEEEATVEDLSNVPPDQERAVPRLAALPLPVRDLTAATAMAIPASIKLGRVTAGDYTWTGDAAKPHLFVPGGRMQFEIVGAGAQTFEFNGVAYTSLTTVDPNVGDNDLLWTGGGNRESLFRFSFHGNLASPRPAVPQAVAIDRYSALVSPVPDPVTFHNGVARFEIAADDNAVLTPMIFRPTKRADGTDIWEYSGNATLKKQTAKGSGVVEVEVQVPHHGTGSCKLAFRSDLFSRSSITPFTSAVTYTSQTTESGKTLNIAAKLDPAKPEDGVAYGGVIYVKTRKVKLNLKSTGARGVVALYLNGITSAPHKLLPEIDWTTQSEHELELPAGDSHRVVAEQWFGDTRIATSNELRFQIRETGPKVIEVQTSTITHSPNGNKVRVLFSRDTPLRPALAGNKASYGLIYKGASGTATDQAPGITNAIYDPVLNAVELEFSKIGNPGLYELTVKPKDSIKDEGIADIVGNALAGSGVNGTPFVTTFEKLTSSEPPISESRGVNGGRAEHVEFKEFEPRREIGEGFNPSDKVVTRVARLYYFRDAHRVAQIVNRTAMSYNKANVEMNQQWADRSLRRADEATDSRKILEVKAVRAAQESRAAENALAQAQQALTSVRSRQAATSSEAQKAEDGLATLRDDERVLTAEIAAAKPEDNTKDKQQKLEQLRRTITQAERTSTRITQAAGADTAEITRLENQINSLVGEVQAKRSAEVLATEASEAAQLAEQRAREEQFRREVAAKTEDPDTFAPGKPSSDDPVAQVSVSVIGEGVIQLRGPLKGVNLIRTMINEIDSPVGQVRIALHTVQVNGEHGDRMEPVVAQMQRYIDHSRFLTNQSAQMLRNAVVKVAARKAQEAEMMCPGGTQLHRDLKYQEAFFGADFIAELRNMDSEFLKTDNKVLSLHSMDTTSLSGALFLMALAKNDVRYEILAEFEALARGKLPQDEMEYLQASLTGAKKREMKRFMPLGQNATFKSLHGFFDAEIGGPDTLSPLQREFIRLAQIFKSRLLAEIELRQRVMERSLMEDGVETAGSRRKTLESLRDHLTKARDVRGQARIEIRKGEADLKRIGEEMAQVTSILRESKDLLARGDQLKEMASEAAKAVSDHLKNSGGANGGNWFCGALLQFGLTTSTRSVEDQMLKVMILGETADKKGNSQKAANGTPTEFDPSTRFAALGVAAITTLKPTYLLTAAQSADEETIDNLIIDELTELISNLAGQQPISEAVLRNATRNLLSRSISSIIGLPEGTQSAKQLGAEHLRDYTWSHPLRKFQKNLAPRIEELLQINGRHCDAVRKTTHWTRLEESWKRFCRRHDRLGPTSKLFELIDCFASLYICAESIELCVEDLAEEAERFKKTIDRFSKDIALQIADPNSNIFQASRVVRELTLATDYLQSRIVHGSPLDLRVKALLKDAMASAKRLSKSQEEKQKSDQELESQFSRLYTKKFMDMFIDDAEDKFIELVEGTRAHIANVDNYIARIAQALEDDFNTQFYNPAFRCVRETSRTYDVQLGQVETTSILTNNRTFAKVSPQATMEFDLPKRDILVNEAFQSALAAYNDYGALVADPNFLSLAKMYGGIPAAHTYGGGQPGPQVRNVLPGLPSSPDARFLTESENNVPRIGSQLDALIPDPSVYSFETGTGWEARPVIQPDGQAVVFRLRYMYTTNIREPVRADEKHLGRIKRHFIDTDVQSGNYELREVSKYTVALKASRTSRGVPLLEDAPGVGVLFRPLPSQESSLQQNIILSQTVIFPTLFDLMGLRWAPAVADLDSYGVKEMEYTLRGRERELRNHVFNKSAEDVDEQLRVERKNPRFYHSQRRPPDEPCDMDTPPRTCPDHCPPEVIDLPLPPVAPPLGQPMEYYQPPVLQSPINGALSIPPVMHQGTESATPTVGDPAKSLPPDTKMHAHPEGVVVPGPEARQAPTLAPSRGASRQPAPRRLVQPVGDTNPGRPVDLERPVEAQRKGVFNRFIPGSRPLNPAPSTQTAPKFDTRSGRPVTQIPSSIPSCKPLLRDASPGFATVSAVSETVEMKKPGFGTRLKSLPGKLKSVLSGNPATDKPTPVEQ
jgi:hypothetical protein